MDKYQIEKTDIVIESKLEVKKSKFIAKVFYINNKEEAEGIINSVKENYSDARHVVYAYRLINTAKFSDDKEPQGTAGKPIYSLLEKQNLVNVLVIVIRYFGGVLLGTGPLTRAYSTVAKDALNKCNIIKYKKYVEQKIECKYNEEDDVKRKLINEGCVIKEIKRTDKIEVFYLAPEN